VKKFEIIITPQNSTLCGKCTYKSKELIRNMNTSVIMEQWVCKLFNKVLSIWIANCEPEFPPERCTDCKKLTENFEKMPELDEF
jgi:hypothetical protein